MFLVNLVSFDLAFNYVIQFIVNNFETHAEAQVHQQHYSYQKNGNTLFWWSLSTFFLQ